MSDNHRPAPEDSELVARAKQGEAEAFGALYERYLDPIYRYIRARVSVEHDAEDLTELVFLRSFEAIERYEERGWPFSAYLYRIARNVLVDHYRKHREADGLGAIESLEHPGPAPEETVIQGERIDRIQEALADLPPDYQEVIRLRIVLSLPTSTVAAWMERSEGAVRVLLYRALKSLREEFLVRDDELER